MTKMMFRLAAFIFSVLVLQVKAQKKFVGVKGKEVLSPDGKPMLIKGVNLGNWLVPEGYMFKFTKVNSPKMIDQLVTELKGPAAAKEFWVKYLDHYVTEKDIHFLKATGSNSVRLPFNYRMFTQENYLGSNDSTLGFKYIDRVVQWCKKENLYLLLDMHCAPGGQTGDNIDDSYGYPFLYTDEHAQQLTIDIWKRIAERYKNEEIIMGYDLLNEPIAHYFDAATINPFLEPLFKRITAEIRKVDKNHLVFLEGAQWASNFKVFTPPFDDKLVYSFHKYWTDTTQKVIQDYVDFSNKYNVPLYMGESGENNDQWITSFRKLLEKNNIGWHFWPFKKMASNSAMITFSQPALYDSIINYSKANRASFEQIRKARPKDKALADKALNDMLENCLLDNCTFNKSYMAALGFSLDK